MDENPNGKGVVSMQVQAEHSRAAGDIPFQKAMRIWTRETDEPNQYAAFRSPFVLNSLPYCLELVIRADNRYAVYINGNYLPAQQYSDYSFYPVYDRLPVPAQFLCVGENLLAVLAYCQNENSSTYRKGSPSVIYELTESGRVLAASGQDTRCSEKTGFTAGPVEKVSPQLSFSFQYNAVAAGEWMDSLTEDASWGNALPIPSEPLYYPRPISQLTVGSPAAARVCAQGVFKNTAAENSGERVLGAWLRHIPFSAMVGGKGESEALPSAVGLEFASQEGDGCYVVVDMLREQAGYVMLDLQTDAPCEIDIGWGEHLEDLRVRAEVGGRNFAFTYTAKAGRNRFMYPFKRLGARYLQLHVGAASFKLFYAGLLPVTYPLQAHPAPKGLNALQKRIYEVSLHTLRSCMHEHYEDTPWREQALYAMDSRNQMLFAACVFRETAFTKASLRLLAYGMGKNGLLELCAPARVPVNIPSFSLAWILALGEYFNHSADSAFLAEMLPYMERVLAFFQEWVREGLLYNPQGYWGFYEWAPQMDGLHGAPQRMDSYQGFDAPLNAFYALALRAAQTIYASLGYKEKALQAEKSVEELKLAYHAAFYNPAARAYRLTTAPEAAQVYPQLVQALTLCAGLCGAAEENGLAKRLLGGEFWPECSLSHRVFLYDAMLHHPALRERVLSDIDDKWGGMLFEGATSFWETAAGSRDFNHAGSLCHGWSAVPLYVYHKIFN